MKKILPHRHMHEQKNGIYNCQITLFRVSKYYLKLQGVLHHCESLYVGFVALVACKEPFDNWKLQATTSCTRCRYARNQPSKKQHHYRKQSLNQRTFKSLIKTLLDLLSD